MTRLRFLAGLIVLLAVGIYPALAQTPRSTYIFRPGLSPIVATATTSSRDGAVTHLSGGVTVVIDGTRIMADQGEVELLKNEIRLRGDVRIPLR